MIKKTPSAPSSGAFDIEAIASALGQARPLLPRTLPWVGEDPARYVVNTHGAFVAQPIGSTEYTTGLHVYAHPAGDAEAARGLYAFCARVEEDGEVTWVQTQSDYVLHHERAAELFPVMLDIARAWMDRDPGGFVCHVLDQVIRELRRHQADRRQVEVSQEYLSTLLADPSQPRTEFKADADGQRRELPATPEEKAARRAYWERSLAYAEASLVVFHLRHGARIDQLVQALERLYAFIQSADRTIEAARALFPLPAAHMSGDMQTCGQIVVDT